MTRALALVTNQTAAAVCVAALLPVGSASAQSTPDFSGRWVLTDSADASSTVAVELTVEQIAQSTSVRAPLSPPLITLTIGRRFKDGVTRLESYTIGIVGGTSSGVSQSSRAISETRYAVRWEGMNIVIETSSDSGENGVHAEHIEVWSMGTPNTLRITATDRGTGIAANTITATYRHP